MKAIVDRYIFIELLPPFLISLAFFSFIFLMTQILEITRFIVNYQIGVKTVFLLIAFTMPFFLQFITPMSVMISVLLTFLRMSGEMEIVALKAGGVSVYRLMPPVIVFAAIGSLMTAFISIYALPQGRQASKQLLYEVATEHLDIGLKPRQFIDSFKDVVMYVHEIDATTKEMRDIFIQDRRSAAKVTSTVVAPQGRLLLLPEKLLVTLRLRNGSIHQVDLAGQVANTLEFDVYDIRLDLSRKMRSPADGPKDEEEMSLAELRQYIEAAKVKDDQYYVTLMEWHKKFSLPVSCLALSLLAIPLGIRARSAKRAYGIGLGLAFFLLYYIMLSVGWVFGETGAYPPLLGMWVPNLVTGAIGVVLLVRAASEKPVILPSLSKWIRRWGPRGRGFDEA